MKKSILFIVIVFISLLIFKYFSSSYEIKYKVDGYEVVEKYDNHYYYFEIDSKFNMAFDNKKDIKLKKIKAITKIGNDEEYCLYPTIDKVETYPLCISNGINTSYDLITNKEIIEFVDKLGIKEEEKETKETFKFFNNLDDNEYLAVYKYNGFYILNGNKIKSVNLFNNDRFDNSLCEQIGNFLLLPSESEFNYNSFVLIDMITSKTYEIEGKYQISFDSIVLGHIDQKVYILDNKNSIEYEIDIVKKKIEIVGDENQGYKVYKDGKLKVGMISELKNKERWNNSKKDNKYSYYSTEEGVFRTLKENSDIKTLIYKPNIVILGENNDDLYILDNDSIYTINPLYGPKKVLLYEELNYNKNNTIYLYNNN